MKTDKISNSILDNFNKVQCKLTQGLRKINSDFEKYNMNFCKKKDNS